MQRFEREETIKSSFVCSKDDEGLARYRLEAGRAVSLAKRAASLAAGHLLVQTAGSNSVRQLRTTNFLSSARAYLADASDIVKSASVPPQVHHRQAHLSSALRLIEQGIGMAWGAMPGYADLRPASPLKQALLELQLAATGLESDEVALQSCCCEFFKAVLRSPAGEGK